MTEETIIKDNNIIEVARELGLNVNKSMVPCICSERHKDSKTPTMNFNIIKNTFKCWVCPDIGGTVVDLVMQVRRVSREKALEYLTIRCDSTTGISAGESSIFNKREKLYSSFLQGIDKAKGIGLVSFISLKGGTGKSMIVNNLAASYSMLLRHVRLLSRSNLQKVELIDLDFGKPDQRIITGVEPQYYLEDIFYNKKMHLKWSDLRAKTRLENLILISCSPVRKSQNLFFMHRNELIYLIHNSIAKIKLADFGGGVNNEILEFLHNIKTKVCVINVEKTAKTAIFNMILTMIYEQLRRTFTDVKKIDQWLDSLRNCVKTNYRVKDLSEFFQQIDSKNILEGKLFDFYQKRVIPFKKLLEMENNGAPEDYDSIKSEFNIIKDHIFSLIFSSQSTEEKKALTYRKKLDLYTKYQALEKKLHTLNPYSNRLASVLNGSRFGLVVNRAEKDVAWNIYNEITEKLKYYMSLNITYLGSVQERDSLRNISDYGMPYAIIDPDDDGIREINSVADSLLGLKEGSVSWAISEQKPFLQDIRRNWG